MRLRSDNKNGIALTVVIVVLMILVMMAGYILSLGYNRRRVVDAASGTRAKIYYRAQAGVYDANVRIRKNYTVGLVPAGSFLTPAYDPGAYNIDVDGNGTNDCTVNIGPVNVATGRRQIDSMGLADP